MNPAFSPELLSRIEDAGLNASAPPQQRWMDGWIVRLSPGKAKRARCVNAVAVGRSSTDARLSACARLFAESQLPLIFRITPFTLPADLDLQLEAKGYRRFEETQVMVLSELPDEAPALPAGMLIEPIGVEPFAQRIGGFRGSPLSQRQAHAQRLRESPVPFHPFELKDKGQVLACGQMAIEGQLVGLYDVFTVPSARGRGLAGLLCRHMLAKAVLGGAEHGYLQVSGDNHAARAVYARLGFLDAYGYHYRSDDPRAA